MVNQTSFQLAFLHPKYWFTWVGIAFLYLLSWLPFKLQIWLGKMLGRLVYHLVKKRRKIAEVNIALCFPHLSAKEQDKLVKENMENTGIAVFESGMAWWWPNWRVKKHFAGIEGYEHIENSIAQGKGVLMLVPHMMHLEMAGRTLALIHKGVGFYRPHNSPLMEHIITKGRLAYNEFLIGKKDVKGLLKALHDKKLCYYLPDQDYGRNRCEFVPFFAVEETCTTTGTLIFASSKKCNTLSFSSVRQANGKYHLVVTPVFDNFPSDNAANDVARVNKAMEEGIMRAPEQYMWLHRRFKTQKDPNAESHYK